MKVAVIIYHKDADIIYLPKWIEECVNSISTQILDFGIFEMRYGTNSAGFGPKKYYCNYLGSTRHLFDHEIIENHIQAMNYMLNKCFAEGYDFVFNINLDDIYSPERFEKQLKFMIEGDYDLVSCEFSRKYESSGKIIERVVAGQIGSSVTPEKLKEIYSLPYEEIVAKGLNIICHPGVLYSRKFWFEHGPYEDSLGNEDLKLWMKSIQAGAKVGIYMDKPLMTHRVHDNNTGTIHKA